jgi:2-C-methyl-D-erythritol 4-phosphate cytidylyltransferase
MNVAIIAAAGQGKRFGGRQAKQFLKLAGLPVIIHTLRPFERCEAIQEIVVVLPGQDTVDFLALAESYNLRKVARVVAGGETRVESVWRGLQAIPSKTIGIVAVHDGARPFVTPDEIDRTVEAAARFGAAILTAPVVDTIKVVKDGIVVRTLPRPELQRALTPQCFRLEIIRQAYETAAGRFESMTDDSALVESLGQSVAVVEGHSRNIKITNPEDLLLAEALLRHMGDDATGS